MIYLTYDESAAGPILAIIRLMLLFWYLFYQEWGFEVIKAV